MNGYKIPTLLNNFNTYASGHKYVGVSSETTLPNFEYLTETLEGTGIVTYRGSMQILNTATQTNDFQGIVVTTKGRVKSFELGTLKRGGKGEPKIVRELTYVKITIGGQNVLELDKFNMVWKLYGVDRLQKVRSQI